ncbi:AAA family ATPase [Allokutzneria sp. A3M-2-11 16]|uniref:ATP-binding protein n=1 Tax=Allokutzneria sp. A3M-2-11 16 TaxID=2962043 RepID=UPI0020B87329|nr:LuxR family transcriptional regulator [Allokutzneria sp. A3M-2-11 16]MCP3803702.1 AAA family ATPase [Allokutzneria sp. A3M-2-11 16]
MIGPRVMLVERERELDEITAALADAEAGRGRTVCVEGVAGIGKTALLARVRAQAGFQVCAAVAGELEQELPFAVVRQLFEPVLRLAGPDVLSGAARFAKPVFGLGGDGDAVAHGLYWLCSNLSEHGPVLLVVDDVHWADESSVRFLSYLARRIADLPVLLVLAGRPVPPEHLLARALTGVQRIVLDPLSEAGVGEVIRRNLGTGAEDAFCRACARVTGGNPFLLTEALSAIVADGISPVAAEADRIGGLRPDTIARVVLTRLAGLGPDAVRLARALAVLGPTSELRWVARLAELTPERAAEAVAALVDEAIIGSGRPLDFVHPLVRTAIYTDRGEVPRAADHRRAALLLAEDGAPTELLAPHLLLAEPEADPLVVEWLRAAASAASDRGSPEAAAAYLRRAIAEPPRPEDRSRLHADLGRAMGMGNHPLAAAEAFGTALELEPDPAARGVLALELGSLMVQTGRPAEARRTFDVARRELAGTDPELPLRLQAALAMAGFVAMDPPREWIARLDPVAARLRGDTPADAVVLATLAFAACAAADRPAGEVAALASRAWSWPRGMADQWILANFVSTALVISDRFDEALAVLDEGLDSARSRGHLGEFRYLSVLRSRTASQAGRLLEAEADGRAALDLHEPGSGEAALAAGVLIDALVDRGELAEAERVLDEHGLQGELPVRMLIDHFALIGRGRLRVRQNRNREALDDLLACGKALAGNGYTNPSFGMWRTEAALAHLALGEVEAAHALVAEELALASSFGAARSVGVALRVLGLVEGGAAGLARLAESVAVLDGTGCEVELARALVDHGAALRRLGRRSEAQHHLRRGLDLAARQRARPLTDRANEELVASGARPRREALTGPAALTGSELRVARLASGGASNREIAQALFVSRRTVEVHLTSSYRKLGITSRAELRHALGSATLP